MNTKKNITHKITSYFKNIGKRELNDGLYHLSLWLIPLLIFLYFVFNLISRFLDISSSRQCFFYSTFHLYCPGCGGTRAFDHLIHGDLLQSIYYNAFVPYFTIIFLVFFVSQTISHITKGEIKGVGVHKWMVILGLIILFVQFIIKNTLLSGTL